MSLTRQAQQIIKDSSSKRAINLAIDATCGNGNDTAFLAEVSSRVLAFDIQEQAIQNTRERLKVEELEGKVELFHRGHEHIESVLNDRDYAQSIDVAMFNFGYLPKSDDLKITTTAESSTQAVSIVLDHLKPSGIVSLLCYRGHDGGAEEFLQIKQLLTGLDSSGWLIDIHESSKATDSTPILFIITKL